MVSSSVLVAPVTLTTGGGPVDLAFAARFLAGWPPATHPGASADGALRLTFVGDDLRAGGVTLRQAGPDAVAATPAGAATATQVRRVLGLDLDGAAFAALGAREPLLGELQARAPGARPVLFGSVYEAAAWGVLSTRTPAARAAALRRTLIAQHGTPVDLDGEPWRAFPEPAAVLDVSELPGAPAEKLRRLHAVAEAAIAGVLDAEALAALPVPDALERLKTVHGIGDFYAMLILLRAVGARDVLPGSEPRILAAAGDLAGREQPLVAAELAALAERWSPFRTWAGFLLRSSGM
ncbi:MAG: DNA-3-methyladenine glycosylase [Baekduia sp.]|jgi:DNA-3-methyladenine glycosylase II|nr:DNA-3-methyladenine glycosylase [Baekduia sp.]